MKVESKTAKSSSKRASSSRVKNSASEASLSQRVGLKASINGGSQRSQNFQPKASGEFDPALHHALRYNVYGFPIEIRKEKTGIQNGKILNDIDISYPVSWQDRPSTQAGKTSKSIFNDPGANRNLAYYRVSKAEIVDPNQGGSVKFRKSLSRLKDLRNREFYPDPSYDLTGDGSVS